MATQKVSVTLEADAIEDARRTSGPRGLSAYLDAALAEKLERDEARRSLLAYLDELEAVDPTREATRHQARRRTERIRNAVS